MLIANGALGSESSVYAAGTANLSVEMVKLLLPIYGQSIGQFFLSGAVENADLELVTYMLELGIQVLFYFIYSLAYYYYFLLLLCTLLWIYYVLIFIRVLKDTKFSTFVITS